MYLSEYLKDSFIYLKHQTYLILYLSFIERKTSGHAIDYLIFCCFLTNELKDHFWIFQPKFSFWVDYYLWVWNHQTPFKPKTLFWNSSKCHELSIICQKYLETGYFCVIFKLLPFKHFWQKTADFVAQILGCCLFLIFVLVFVLELFLGIIDLSENIINH